MSSGSVGLPSAAAWGNAVALACLALVGLLFLRLNDGAWWIAFPRLERWWWAGAVLAVYLGTCVGLWFARRQSAAGDVAATSALMQADTATILVVYASQTGFARELAARTAEALSEHGTPALLSNIDKIDAQRLSRGGTILFVVSTTGEGDPPDHALGFVRDVMSRSVALDALQYGVLALGDRSYEEFCAFGRRLDRWLQKGAARPLFDVVEVDNADETALRRWQLHLSEFGDAAEIALATPRFQTWRLTARREVNPGSHGNSVYHLALHPPAATSLAWEAGDIAEVRPRNRPDVVAAIIRHLNLDALATVRTSGGVDTLANALARAELPPVDRLVGMNEQAIADMLKPHSPRAYSIASLPMEGSLQLLLRRITRPDGTLGICSGWLCEHAATQTEIELRIRSNPNFRVPEPSRGLILIGNGTGMAGLRCLLKARADAGASQNWLLFGERHRDRDFFFAEDIERWQAGGVIQRLDLAFSREQEQRVYVQHKLLEAADELRQWVHEGAAVFVCGSLIGMAPAVDRVIGEILGEARVEQMRAAGLYCRDVY